MRNIAAWFTFSLIKSVTLLALHAGIFGASSAIGSDGAVFTLLVVSVSEVQEIAFSASGADGLIWICWADFAG